jgi:hypothetical protein
MLTNTRLLDRSNSQRIARLEFRLRKKEKYRSMTQRLENKDEWTMIS